MVTNREGDQPTLPHDEERDLFQLNLTLVRVVPLKNPFGSSSPQLSPAHFPKNDAVLLIACDRVGVNLPAEPGTNGQEREEVPVSVFTGPAHFAALNVRTETEVQITEGSVALLFCSFDCSPNSDNATTIEWSRVSDGSKILVKNGNYFKPHPRMEWAGDESNCDATIRVNDAETRDSDSYRCKVIRQPSNDQGFSVVRLRVSETRGLVVRAPGEVTAVQGDTALLPCSYFCGVKGNNDTLVEWYKTINGEKKKIYKIELRSLNEPRVKWMGDESKCDSSISMSNIQNDDSGRYHCEVTLLSFLKQGSKALQLRVQEAAPGLYRILQQ
ncbi:unnamed protein product [Lampetra fluviatilis]